MIKIIHTTPLDSHSEFQDNTSKPNFRATSDAPLSARQHQVIQTTRHIKLHHHVSLSPPPSNLLLSYIELTSIYVHVTGPERRSVKPRSSSPRRPFPPRRPRTRTSPRRMPVGIPSTVIKPHRGSWGTVGFARRAFVGIIGCPNSMDGESPACGASDLILVGRDADDLSI